MSFFTYALTQIINKDNLLVKVDSIVDWNELSAILDKSLGKRETTIAGKVPYEYIKLFKALLIQQWHTLSDPKMEEALKTRIDFMWFSGFGLATNEFIIPDETTICRFRNKLAKAEILNELLAMVNQQLQQSNLKVKISDGAILDATLITAAVNSRAKPNVIIEDRHEDDDNYTTLTANEQSSVEIDKDAKWLKKGKHTVFGYKEFITTDATDGYIETIALTPANTSEVNYLEQALSAINPKEIKVLYTDKGYASKHNVEYLKNNKVGNGIMAKATRNAPLTYKQKQRNKRISKTRYIVERTNATIKNIFKLTKTRYVGLARVKNQTFLVAIAHNLLKAANKIKVHESFYKKVVFKNCLFGLFA